MRTAIKIFIMFATFALIVFIYMLGAEFLGNWFLIVSIAVALFLERLNSSSTKKKTDNDNVNSNQ